MPGAYKPRTNSSLWLGLIAALSAVFCNFAFFLNPPAQSAIPWLSLGLAAVALIFLALGAKNLFAQPRTIAARIFGVVVVLFSLLLSVGSIFGFYKARAVPPSTDSPQIGQKVPDFTMTDTHGQSVSLARLFAPAPTDAASPSPKAVLLVFYRGYWWPYCLLELRGIEKLLPEFKAAGIRVVAISVDPPDVSTELAGKAGFTFTILSDPQAEAIRRYHLLHVGGGPDGHDISRPAEFLLDSTGTVRWRNLTEDVRVRARANEMLAVARTLQ
jgi:peroxiredoxin